MAVLILTHFEWGMTRLIEHFFLEMLEERTYNFFCVRGIFIQNSRLSNTKCMKLVQDVIEIPVNLYYGLTRILLLVYLQLEEEPAKQTLQIPEEEFPQCDMYMHTVIISPCNETILAPIVTVEAVFTIIIKSHLFLKSFRVKIPELTILQNR